MGEPHHTSTEAYAHRETKKPAQKHNAHSHLGPQARGTKCPQKLLLPNTKCMHAGSARVYSIWQPAATSKKWTNTVQSRRGGQLVFGVVKLSTSKSTHMLH